jgi:hypothetical protein
LSPTLAAIAALFLTGPSTKTNLSRAVLSCPRSRKMNLGARCNVPPVLACGIVSSSVKHVRCLLTWGMWLLLLPE